MNTANELTHFSRVDEEDFTLGHVVGFAPGQHAGEGALAGAVRAHDGVDLTGVDGQVDAAEDFFVVHAGVEVFDGEHHS